MELIPIRNPRGKPVRYTPDELEAKFIEYVKWCDEHPIEVTTTTTYANGNWSEVVEKKPRLICLTGFELFAGVDASWWSYLNTRKRAEEYIKVKAKIKNMCEMYQKEMASAGVFNANIISRLLGLADKQQTTQTITNKIIVESKEQGAKIEGIGDIG